MAPLSMVIVGVLALALVVLPVPALTALGARRRGVGPALAVMAGLFFPITWTVWYLRDEHPYRRSISA
jgi:hypothetical protein